MTPTKAHAFLLSPAIREIEDALAKMRQAVDDAPDDVQLAQAIATGSDIGQAFVGMVACHLAIVGQRSVSAAIHNAIEEGKPLSEDAKKALLNTTALAGLPTQ